jgi:hypothetical protein
MHSPNARHILIHNTKNVTKLIQNCFKKDDFKTKKLLTSSITFFTLSPQHNNKE